MIKQYGNVDYNGTNLTLQQEPYLSGTNEAPHYEACACDDAGNDYSVTWRIKDGWEEMEDQSECCDWDLFDIKQL